MMLISYYFLVLISLLSISYVCSISKPLSSPLKPILVLNSLDNAGYDGILWFLESLQLYAYTSLFQEIHIYYDPTGNITAQRDHSKVIILDINIYYHVYDDHQYDIKRDTRIANAHKQEEHVTKIIYAWNHTLSQSSIHEHHIILSCAFHIGSIPMPTISFHHIIMKLYDMDILYDLYLLSKTKKMTSISNWHDFSFFAYKKNQHVYDWLNIYHDIFSYYSSSSREAYSMIDPRFAILEAHARMRDMMKISYFDIHDICSSYIPFDSFYDQPTRVMIHDAILSNHDHNLTSISSLLRENNSQRVHDHDMMHYHIIPNQSPQPGIDSRCPHLQYIISNNHNHHHHHDHNHNHDNNNNIIVIAPIEVYCGHSYHMIAIHDMISCATLHLPQAWKKHIDRDMQDSLGSLGDCSFDELKEQPVKMMWRGALRFKDTENHTTPRPFCWENKKNTVERLSESRIEHNISYSELFNHPHYQQLLTSKSTIKAVIITASKGSAHDLDIQKYITISKMYYAKRHGYNYAYATSLEYLDYFPPDIYDDIKTPMMQTSYFRGIMTKPLMMLDVMYRHLDQEWLVWTDDDVYINPGWLYLPLDVFLGDVPPHKVMVMSNYRSAFTNILFIRNNAQGRRLMMDWIAIVMSGYIQCHGFDQAALAALIAQRVGQEPTFPWKPLNFTCLFTVDGNLGCNTHNDWSCDFKFEAALYKAGFKTRKADLFFRERMSSFSKGCANDVIPEFHVVTETQYRPRLQCGLCTRLDEIESSSHWDGPLGAGNLPLNPKKINGYMMNHKAEFLFYESYLKDQACLYMKEDVVPPCEIQSLKDHLPQEDIQNAMIQSNRHLLSLTDGYAFDVDLGTYCRLANQRLLEHQKSKTYMRHYQELIEAVQKISPSAWDKMYKDFAGGDGRGRCTEGIMCPYGENKEDGQVKRRPKPIVLKSPYTRKAYETWRRDNDLYFERENYCETCRKVNSTSLYGKHEYVVDCRTEREAAREDRDNFGMGFP